MKELTLDYGRFNTLDLAHVAGVPKSVIADWIERKLISGQGPVGRGKTRTFTLWNVVEASAVSILNKMGIRSGDLVAIIEVIASEARLRPGSFEDFTLVLRIGTDGQLVSGYREGPLQRINGWVDDQETAVTLRINVRFVVEHVKKVLQI